MLFSLIFSTKLYAQSESPPPSLISEFLTRIEKGFNEADVFMEETGILEKRLDLRGLPDGETLIFDIRIPPRLEVEGVVFGEISNETVLISLRDFVSVLQFPIKFDSETNTFSGWFLLEGNTFQLNLDNEILYSAGQEYKRSKDTHIIEEDIMVPIGEIKEWFNMGVEVDISAQKLILDPATPFPATQRYNRRKKDFSSRGNSKPELPLMEDDYDLFEVPVADITTRSNYRKRENGDTEFNNFANVRTAGEFLKGNLTTNTAINDTDGIFSARVTYLQESIKPELLGGLKARRFEVGDLSPTRVPITGNSGQETGIRITNANPLVNLSLPSTRIEGYYFPNWDIELYRDNSLLSFQTTDSEGYYVFEDVPLFSDKNFFRVVAYGPQGEIREEILNIPYDRNQVAANGGVYDISVTLQERQFYSLNESSDVDKNSPHVVAFYEIPVLDSSALRLGGRYRQEEGENKLYGSVGLSTSINQTLLNADFGADEQGEAKTELSATRNFGQHRTRVDLDLSTDNYNPGGTSTNVNVLSNRYNIEGPLGIGVGINPRYSGNFRYDMDSNNNASSTGQVNLNTQFNRLSLNQSFDYFDSDKSAIGTEYGGTTALTGFYKSSLFRALARYDFSPESELSSLSAFWKYRINSDFDSQFQIDHSFDDNELTKYSTQLNWRLDEAVLTPRVSYDSRGNIEALLSTRFSVAQEPVSGDFIMTRDSLTDFGSLSAFVYLDKNGNFQFDEDDEPIDQAKIIAPQNGGGGFTDKDGVAYLTRFRPSLITDVYLDNASLEDPFWISAKKGHSIMPRTGNHSYMEFPVHISGEVDGTIYKRNADQTSSPAQNVSVAIFNMRGEMHQQTLTSPDGFYLFSLIPPGKYYLMINDTSISKGYGRPFPKIIEIGYDGTVLYSQDIVLEAGRPDVPINIKTVKSNENNAEQKITLNLGEFNSPLMSAYTWHKLVKDFSYYLGGAQRISNENDPVLRASLPENTMSAGYNRCSALVRGGAFCEVEINIAGISEEQD